MVENNKEFTFKCGRMDIVDNTVKPVPNKGYIKIYINEDMLLCWEWYDLATNKTSQDEPFVIFENNWSWNKVPSTKGAVYQLKNLEYDESYFYWLQEPKDNTELYNKIEIKVSEILKSGKLNLSNINNNYNTVNSNKDKTNTQYILDQISNALRGNASSNIPGLRRILTSNNIKKYLMSEEFINKCLKHLPEEQQTKEYYIKNFSSPQFYDALNSFSSALNSENYKVILSSFELNDKEFDNKYGVEGFIYAITKTFKKKD